MLADDFFLVSFFFIELVQDLPFVVEELLVDFLKAADIGVPRIADLRVAYVFKKANVAFQLGFQAL